MPRLEPVEPPYEPKTEDTLRRLMGPVEAEPLNLFRTIAHHDVLLERFRQIGSSLLSFGRLPDEEREAMILRTTARCGAAYEWGVHKTAFRAGADADALWSGAVPEGRLGVLARLCDELHETATVSDALWEELRSGWSDDELVELICLAGFYHLVSYACNAFAVDAEPWAAQPPA
jgi:alkylhydroperoxidase family enzyme